MSMARYKQQVLDKLVGKMVSRKLLVWLVATLGVPLQYIDGEQWVMISMVYIGSATASNFIVQYVRAKQGLPANQDPDSV